MKHLLLTAAALGLAGTAHADSFAEARAAAMKAFCSHGESCQPVLTDEQYKTLREEENDESLVTLRRAGLTPGTAQKAVWALNHKPQSSCADLASKIVVGIDMARSSPDNPATAYSPDMDVILIERNHLCDRNRLDR